MEKILFSETRLGNINVKNRVVMAPMTRCRALKSVPNELMAEYYEQRSSMGLIITEGTAISPNSRGYARMPGIWSRSHIEGWKKVTERVHSRKGLIFLQIMHTGRIGHILNMPAGSEIIAPSSIAAKGEICTDSSGMQSYPVPREMSLSDIRRARDEFVRAAKNAVAAGFDGVELHGANGYLLDQFLQPDSNHRKDNYGGSHINRCRFVIEVAEDVQKAIGRDKVGIRLSPYGSLNDISPFDETEEQYLHLVGEINRLGLAYIHLADHSHIGSDGIPIESIEKIRKVFKSKIILCGGYTFERAENELFDGPADLIAFGRPAIANPDLVERFLKGLPLNKPDEKTFYTPGAKGYTDYPFIT